MSLLSQQREWKSAWNPRTAGHQSRTPLTEAVPVFRDCVGDTEGGSGWNGGAKRAEARLATPIASWCRRKPRRANTSRKKPPTSPPCWWSQQRNVGSSDEEKDRGAEEEHGQRLAVFDDAGCASFKWRRRVPAPGSVSAWNNTPAALASSRQHEADIRRQLATGRGAARRAPVFRKGMRRGRSDRHSTAPRATRQPFFCTSLKGVCGRNDSAQHRPVARARLRWCMLRR